MSDDTAALFVYEAGNYQNRYGGRVFADGRYELYDSVQPDGAPQWTAYSPFTAEQMQQIHAVVDAALGANLPDHIERSMPPFPDADSATLTVGGRQIVVDEWPQTVPAEIKQLMDLIAEFRKPEAS